jgi:hypothetical protein
MEGAGYVAENDIKSNGTIDAQTSTSATGNTLGVDQEVSVTGDTDLHLEGEKADNKAGQNAGVENGTLNSKQTLDIGNSVHASLDTSIEGVSGYAHSYAEDVDGNRADTYAGMDNGTMSTSQNAEAETGGSAKASQETEVGAEHGYAVSWAEDADGNWAETYAGMDNGTMSTSQNAEAETGGSAKASQETEVGAEHGHAVSWAEDADGNMADTYAGMDNGTMSTSQNAEAETGGSANVSNDLIASGDWIYAYVEAWNQYGYTFIKSEVYDGTLDSESEARANEDEAFCSQDMDAAGWYIYKFVKANNYAGPYASDTTEVWDGTLTASSTATVDETSATVTDPMSATGDIWKVTYAEDPWVGYSVIYLRIDNGALNGESSGSATWDGTTGETITNQNSEATGDSVGTYAQSQTGYVWILFPGGMEPIGMAEFGAVVRDGTLTSDISSSATLNLADPEMWKWNQVNIIPITNIPAEKNAIILEPYHFQAIGYAGATPMEDTVFPCLVDYGYAVTHFMNNAANKDKYQDLDNYGVALVIGHMNPSTIANLWGGDISATELNGWYTNPPPDALIILCGCSSFEGCPTTSSPLANAVDESYLAGGYTESVGILWAHDYMAMFFQKMSEGMTAEEANDFVWDTYRPIWKANHPGYPDSYIIKLCFLPVGHGDLELDP